MRGSGIRSSHEGTDPESVSEETEKNTPEGEVASEYMKNLLEGGSVYLEYDSELTDTYGRTLCYVYLHDKETMVNELLVRNGYARTLTIKPNTKYRERLYAVEVSGYIDKAAVNGLLRSLRHH
ncbi:thermonuclease family protein [Butyrivibrio sp.]|uniref:thermonuclease family protein n=1 Tax=Butyrivibrio sp. TaxID=28121 RepID=UPI0025B87A98|nr:thermonuclease family protein [Butyrivibrio sp.]MBQ9305217.1 thermonuclease family protein [Butyrivibrio sp.]